MKEFADAAEKFGETDPNLENIINEFSNTLRNVSQNISEKVLNGKQIKKFY